MPQVPGAFVFLILSSDVGYYSFAGNLCEICYFDLQTFHGGTVMKLLIHMCGSTYSLLIKAFDWYALGAYLDPNFDARMKVLDDYHDAYDLYCKWRKARPFLCVGESTYATGLVLRMISAQTQYLRMRNKNIENDELLKQLYRLLNSHPPGHSPPKRPCNKQGLFLLYKTPWTIL